MEGANERNKTVWEQLYDKAVFELRTNLVYVLVICLGVSLYKSEESRNALQRAESDRMIKDRDEWRNLATKATSRNFDYVDILIKSHEYQNSSITDTISDTIEQR